MADEVKADESVTAKCTGLATCECEECGEAQLDYHLYNQSAMLEDKCFDCGLDSIDSIHVTREFFDPAEPPSEVEVLAPIASEVTTGELTHVVLQWGSKYHMLRKGKKEGSPVPLTQPCFLTIGGETWMALSDLFAAQGVYKVEKLK